MVKDFNIATHGLKEYNEHCVDFLYSKLFYSEEYRKTLERTVRILYVGKRAQKACLAPLLDKINDEKYKRTEAIGTVELTTIGHAESEGFFKNMTGGNAYSLIEATEFKDANFKLILKPSNGKNIKDFSFSLPLDMQHEGDSHYSFNDPNTKFDIIFCSWEFHFDLNWRLAHTHLLKYLNEGGSLVFMKTTGDSSLFDGNFKEGQTKANEKLYNLMWKFDNDRNKRVLPNDPSKESEIQDFFWNPEISTSDYYQMRKQAEWYFEEVAIDNQTNGSYKGNLKRDTLIDYFKNQAFSYLKIGVEKSITDDFAKRAEGLESDIVINKKLQYYVARGFLPDYLKRLPSRHWRYGNLIKQLQELNDNDPDKLSRKALDTLVSHDIFLPQHTVSCSFFYWLGDDTNHWDYPVHLVNSHILADLLKTKQEDTSATKSDIFKEFLELMTLESLNLEEGGQGVFRYLIRDIKNKMQISFQFFNDQTHLDTLIEEEKFDKSSKKGDALVYDVKYDKKRKPISLKLAFTRALFDVKSMKAFVDLMGNAIQQAATKHENSASIPVTALTIRDAIDGVRGSIKRFSISEKMQDAFNAFASDSGNTDHFKAAFKDVIDKFNQKHPETEAMKTRIKAISDIINKIDTPSVSDAKMDKTDDLKEAQLFQKVLMSIGLFIWDNEDFELSFYPSAAVENETKYSEGLGGIVVSEKLFKPKGRKALDKNQISLLLARNNALIEASNQIFYKIGISDHVNHQYRKFALQSAVATIISRNGSHGIGSHAIPSLVNDHRDLWQRGNKEALLAALRDDDIFYKYLQDRFEFITQLGNPSLPKWTLTTWFGKDLMKRFLMQRHLLNNLASSERLRAYEFLQQGERNVEKALATDAGDDYEFLYGKVEYGEMVNGKIEQKKIEKDENNNYDWFILETKSERQANKPFTRRIEWKKGKAPKNTEGLSKIRVSGKLGVKNGTPYLKDAELVTSRILIKVRLRQFLAYDEHGKPNMLGKKEAMKDTSEKISQAIHVIRHDDKEKLELIIKRKIEEKQQEKAKNEGMEIDPHLYFYGIVCKEYNEVNNQLTIRLGKGDDTTVVLTLKHAFESTDHLRIGRRILFIDEDIRMDKKPSTAFNKVIIKELLFSKNIIHPKEDAKMFEKDIPVSIVGGIVGYQAFYSILENIIRNAAKHNWQLFKQEEKDRKNLVVTIELEDQLDDDSYICKVWTNTTDVRYKKGMQSPKEEKGAQEEAEKERTQETPIPVFGKDALVEQLRVKLESPIIQKDGQPKQEDIGVSEIKICAAFLAGKDWTRDPSVLTGSKALLKHKTDRKASDKEGYIRTFVAWEAEDGKLIPRLGYRFRLLKAKEFLFFVPNEDAEMTTHIGEWTKTNKASKMVSYSEESPNLDYEYCVLIAPKKGETLAEGNKKPLMSRLLAYINDPAKAQNDQQSAQAPEGEALEQQQKMDELLKLTISYPHRLMLVCDDIKMRWANLKTHKHIADYLKKRIVFVKRKRFEKMLKEDSQNMPFWLYNQWVDFVEGLDNNFKLDITIDADGDNSVGETARMNIPTLPFSLRGDAQEAKGEGHTEGEDSLKEKLKKFYDKRQESLNKLKRIGKRPPVQSNTAKPKTIKFARHQPYDANTHFLESLSGGKVSFSTFANIEHIEEGECHKFFMQLMEAAQNFVLVLDERIMEYALGDSQKYNQFENANILVPTKFSINGRPLHEEKEKSKEPKKEGEKIDERTIAYTVKEGNKEVEKLAIWFNQQGDKLNGKPWRITTVIIHQTLLEKIIDKSAGNDKVKENREAINDFIRWLKIEKGIPSVIITSGRGKNNNTSDLAKFIPFSDISSLLMQYSPEKWMLNRIITESLH
jgi:hypothetical protein